MKRSACVLAAFALVIGFAGVVPAGATHCNQNNAADCPDPLTVIVVEGIGNVCSAALTQLTAAEKLSYGTKCTYRADDPSWAPVASRPGNPWNRPGYTTGNAYQGLFWPGVGPGAIGPYALVIGSTTAPPGNACVSSVGLAGCSNRTVGKLTPGNQSGTGQTGIGAHCGSSQGKGTVEFVAADRSLSTKGNLGWDQSAATILPFYGEILTATRGTTTVTYPAGSRPSVRGFSSSRGFGGAGNCGITDPTTGFQVEGMTVTF